MKKKIAFLLIFNISLAFSQSQIGETKEKIIELKKPFIGISNTESLPNKVKENITFFEGDYIYTYYIDFTGHCFRIIMLSQSQEDLENQYLRYKTLYGEPTFDEDRYYWKIKNKYKLTVVEYNGVGGYFFAWSYLND